MRRSGWLGLLAAGALALTGCSATVGPPEVTFYGDGHSIATGPAVHCDALVRNCDKNPEDIVTLNVRKGMPVQISVPTELSKTPWLVNVQYADAKGDLQVKQQFFAPGSTLAYTATPGGADNQLVVVEVQQIGAAYAADQDGKPILDENGNPQLVARAYWSLQIKP
ncbi:DUF2771 family protein [Amycolatopsis alkalitolerans]|uniref:DUF2771 family protein n=1 Tax=Amycolatopsis alkalitolerans TaxID=2547244 RepID=A0A5C4M4S1_9PSEU|nr:DUF2771 family protein [Amycolatopsis alkalitolerans]TNC28149.1 DUF2771 family protein [Amycolatopsis alkalitolerans]